MSLPVLEITGPDEDRYSTLNLISWWDQARLRDARVMVVGAGALGNEVLKNLALVGVGHIFVADFDRIQVSNLSRSVLFREEDAGSLKAEIAAERLREINPEITVVPWHGDVTSELGLGVYRKMDLVLGCLDNRAARLAVNRACWRTGTPWIDGALDVLMGVVRIFVPPDTACYECTMTPQDYAIMNLRYSCPIMRPEDIVEGRMLTTPTSASLIGALQVQEAVKRLHGQETPAGCGLYYNGQTYRLQTLRYTRREDCGSHETFGDIVELAAGTSEWRVRELLETASAHLGGEAQLLLDVEVVRRFQCPECGRDEVVYRPFDLVVPAQVPCPFCGANRVPDVATRLALDTETAAVPLAQLGIPPLSVLRIESLDRQALFELTGDLANVLKGWRSG